MKQNPALTYEQLMLLDLDQIRELFPHGAREWKKRWLPVLEGEEPDRPLKRLLKDKRDLREKPRFLTAGPPYRNEKERLTKKDWTSEEEYGYTTASYKAMDKLECVDESTQRKQTEDAHADDNTRTGGDELLDRQARVIANKLVKLQREAMKFGIDLSPKLQGLIEQTQAEIVQQRREAA